MSLGLDSEYRSIIVTEKARRASRAAIGCRGLRELVEAAADPSLPALHEVHQRLERAGERIVRRATDQGAVRPGLQGSDIGVIARCVMAAADMTDAAGWRRYLTLLLDGLRNRPDAEPLPLATIRSTLVPKRRE